MEAPDLPPGFAVGVARVVATSSVRPGERFLRLASDAVARMDTVDSPAPAVRLLIPPAGHPVALPTATIDGLVYTAGGVPPTARTFTIRRLDHEHGTIDVEIRTAHDGVASRWAATVATGDEVGIAGPKLFAPLPDAPQHVLLGDASARPAIDAIAEQLAAAGHPDVRSAVEPSSDAARLIETVRGLDVSPAASVWIAGEATMVRAVRRYVDTVLSAEGRVRVCGYWRRRTSSTELDDALLRVTQHLVASDGDLAQLDEFALSVPDEG